jgi:hypothetical protein
MTRPLSDSPNPGAGLRATAELRRDPARSDALIGLAARCTDRTIQRYRRRLEQAGVIPPVPSRQRTWAAWPSRNPGAYVRAVQQLALDPDRTVREIAEAARCTHPTVLRALRARAAQASAAAAVLEALFDRARMSARPRPCCPGTHHGDPEVPVGWRRESPSAVNLCLRYCLAAEACAKWSLTLDDNQPGVFGGMTRAERLARKRELRPG